MTAALRASCRVELRTAPNGGGLEESPEPPRLPLLSPLVFLNDQAPVTAFVRVLGATEAPAVAHLS